MLRISKYDESKMDLTMTKLGISIFTQGQRNFLHEYTTIMEIIANALDNLQANKHPYAVVLPTLFQTKERLNEMVSSSNTLVYCKPLLSAVTNGFNKRFCEIMDFSHDSSIPALIATVTHPFFKLRWLNPELCTTEQTDKIKQILSYAADEISIENAAVESRNNASEGTNQPESECSC